MSETVSAAELVGGIKAQLEANAKEHRRRMEVDPAYREEHEARLREREALEREENEAKERKRRQAIEDARDGKKIPRRYWPHLDAYRRGATEARPASIVKAHAEVERFLGRSNGWTFLFLAGPVGTGKTTEAAWFLDALEAGEERDPWGGPPRPFKREASGLFVTSAELTRASNFDGEFWEQCIGAPRLVIDDLGDEQLDGTGRALGNLTHLLTRRHADDLATVITLNLTRSQVLARFASHDGGRLRDRLNESAWFVELTGPSLRKPLAVGGPR